MSEPRTVVMFEAAGEVDRVFVKESHNHIERSLRIAAANKHTHIDLTAIGLSDGTAIQPTPWIVKASRVITISKEVLPA